MAETLPVAAEPSPRWRRRAARLPSLVTLLAATALAGCGAHPGGYLPASALARGGFAGGEQAARLSGRQVRLWGFVDQGNLYGDAGANRVLGEWWSGEGPDADTWRFNLKAEADGPVGRSFAVHVANDAGRDDLLERFVADARAGRPTKVYLRGTLFRFDAPTQLRDLTGLYLEIDASRDIRFDPGLAGAGPSSGT